jgi:hypothetical protein
MQVATARHFYQKRGTMATTSFGFSQADDGTTRIARVIVPGTGRNERDDAPIIMVEIEKNGNMKLLVYADILSKEATHEIPLNGALLAKKDVLNG